MRSAHTCKLGVVDTNCDKERGEPGRAERVVTVCATTPNLQVCFSNFFFNGDGNDPNVQATIKTNYISVMTSPYVPPFFCLFRPAECNQDTVQLYVGASTV
ncbi:hypothetical protein ACROYT_G019927 [Oculina patagonica]